MFHVWQISKYLIWLKFTICLRWYSYPTFNIYFLLYISAIKHVCFIADYVCLEMESRSWQIRLSFVDITDQYVIRNYQSFIFIIIVTGCFLSSRKKTFTYQFTHGYSIFSDWNLYTSFIRFWWESFSPVDSLLVIDDVLHSHKYRSTHLSTLAVVFVFSEDISTIRNCRSFIVLIIV